MSRVVKLFTLLLLLSGTRAEAQYLSRAHSAYVVADSSGGRNHAAGALTGAKWGALIGAGVGVFGALTGEDCTNFGDGSGNHCSKVTPGGAVFLVAITTALGTVVGAGIGAIVGKHQVGMTWRYAL